MSKPYRIAIAGLGTVGCGTVKIIQNNQDLLSARAGRPIEIRAVAARDQNKERGVDLSGYEWAESPAALAAYDDIDAVVELIGGAEGVALDLAEQALSRGLDFITANKALIAHHGMKLAALAEKHNAALAYEAAVAGGVPAIKALREGLSANRIKAIYGILNGTCNYILTQMEQTGRNFAHVLKDAQDLGYAEADPEFDIDGIDAGHKICILSAIGFGVQPDFTALDMKGIREVGSEDIAFARELGFKIKLLGIAKNYNGEIAVTVEPCMIPANAPLASVDDVYNAVYFEGDFVETPMLTGLGAGERATASAVVADIVDLARGLRLPAFGVATDLLKPPVFLENANIEAPYYIRLSVLDQPGVLADVAAILRDCNISIESLLQRGHDPDQPVAVIMTTHEAKQGDVKKACEAIREIDTCIREPYFMRIESEL